MTQHRKRRGAKTAALAAEWFRGHGWPFATDVGAGRPGRDIENMPGLACEVKGRRDFQPLAWLRQAEDNATRDIHHADGAIYEVSDLPFVVFRPDGMGPATIDRWPVLLRLSDFTDLLREAGYGSPDDDHEECSNCGHRAEPDDLAECVNSIPGHGRGPFHCWDCVNNGCCGGCQDQAAREWAEEHGPRSRV